MTLAQELEEQKVGGGSRILSSHTALCTVSCQQRLSWQAARSHQQRIPVPLGTFSPPHEMTARRQALQAAGSGSIEYPIEPTSLLVAYYFKGHPRKFCSRLLCLQLCVTISQASHRKSVSALHEVAHHPTYHSNTQHAAAVWPRSWTLKKIGGDCRGRPACLLQANSNRLVAI